MSWGGWDWGVLGGVSEVLGVPWPPLSPPHPLPAGGNSRTAMIAALSPADINYEETLSTLR